MKGGGEEELLNAGLKVGVEKGKHAIGEDEKEKNNVIRKVKKKMLF